MLNRGPAGIFFMEQAVHSFRTILEGSLLARGYMAAGDLAPEARYKDVRNS